MAVGKTQAILIMYDRFLKEGTLTKADILSLTEISSITFKRYISELRCYFGNFAPQYEIIYDRESDCYQLKEGTR